MIKYIKQWITYFRSARAINKHQKHEVNCRNCRNNIHAWRKNPYWYQLDKHGNTKYYSKYEFSEITGWCKEVYYNECEYCGHKHVTRNILRYD